MNKGTTAARAVLVIIGAMMAISALSASIQPLNSLLGVSERSSDFEDLNELAQNVRESCTEAENSESVKNREVEAEFSSLNRLELINDEKTLKGFFDGDTSWESQTYNCNLALDIDGADEVFEGEWQFEVSASNAENLELSIQADKK